MSAKSTPVRRTAVVIGGSMAGLSAAAVLSSRFASVVIVERDTLADHPADRKGVPQGRHAHGLLPPGMMILEGWFPGLIDELVAGGAPLLDLGDDALWYQGDGARRRFATGVKGPLASRALLEFHVRRRTLALPNVTLRSGAGVTGLLASADGAQVTGVTLHGGATLGADLVVDASGRSGRSLRWLADLGYDAPPVSEVDIDVAYASRIFRRDPRQQTGFEFALVLAGPPTGRQGVAFPLEGDRWIELSAPDGGLRPSLIFMDEPSVMGTENALLAAALTPGPTTIQNAACEPHVQDLARLLVQMGAQIDGIGSNTMTVHGRDKLGGAEHTIGPDHIEVASFMALAAATGGELRIRDAEPQDLVGIRRQFRRLGLQTMIEGRDVIVPPEQNLRIEDDIGDVIPKIDDGPWPAFPADLTSIALALATQAKGTILIFEKMFENRLFFVDKLVAMGARITLCDPHRAIVSGPSRLHGAHMESPDIRAGMAMLIAALAAEGTSEIGNVRQIDRGYERIDVRLRELGARIDRVASERVPA